MTKLKCPRLMLWIMFVCWCFPTLILGAQVVPKEASDLVNPIYILSVVIGLLFTCCLFFLSKWIKDVERDIGKLNTVLYGDNGKEVGLCYRVNTLKTQHDMMMEKCGIYSTGEKK
jgi:hypothetical protein